jgi:hypothetical protein
MYMKLILEELVKKGWFSWDALERMMEKFKFRNKDSNNRPAPLRQHPYTMKAQFQAVWVIWVG